MKEEEPKISKKEKKILENIENFIWNPLKYKDSKK